MKRKLLLAAVTLVAAVFGGGGKASAQSWTPSEVGAGDFYLYNVESGKYFTYGTNWGTRGCLVDAPVTSVNLAVSGSGYALTIPSISGKYKKGMFLNGSNIPYCDGDAAELTFTEISAGSKTYTISVGSRYLACKEDYSKNPSPLETIDDGSSSRAKWKLVTRANLVANLSNATKSAPVDATFYINGAEIDEFFNNGDAWEGTDPTFNGRTGDLEATGFAAENYWGADVRSYQTLSDIPNGKYRVSCFGFYRDGSPGDAYTKHGNGTENIKAYLYAGNISNKTPLSSIIDGAADSEHADGGVNAGGNSYVPNDMAQAVLYFFRERYPSIGTDVFVENQTLEFGILKEAGTEQKWTIWDRFRLLYYGPTISTTAIALPDGGAMLADTWYYIDITAAADDYAATATTLGDIVYTTAGETLLEDVESLATSSFTETNNSLSVTRYYVKSSSANNLVVAPASYSYTVGDATLSVADGAYSQTNTITLTYASATTNDPAGEFKILNASKIKVNDVAATAEVNDATKVLTITLANPLATGASYVVSVAAGAVGYNDGNANTAVNLTVKTPAVFDGYYYIKKNDADLYFSRGGDQNKQAVLDAFGVPVNITTTDANVSRIKFVDTGLLLGASGSSNMLWTDKGTDPNQINWTIAKDGGNFKFYLYGMEDAKKGMNIDGTTAPKTDTEANAYAWALELPAAHPAKLQAVKDAQAASVATSMSFDGITTQAQMATYLSTNYGETSIEITGTGASLAPEAFEKTANTTGGNEYVVFAEETVNGLTPGIYRLRVYAFERIAGHAAVYNAGGAAGLAYVYATSNSVTQKVKLASLFDYTSDTPWKEGNDVTYGGKYYPNGQEGAQAAFNAGKYANDVYVKVVDEGSGTGSIQFGIKQPNCYYSESTPHNNSQWICYNNFSLVKFEAKATDEEKADLANAITAAEDKTLGFETYEYAPYNNVDALEALAAAKAIDPATVTGVAAVAATAVLTGATWTANDDDVDAVYNGSFSSTKEGDWGLTAWTRTNSWGQQRTGIGDPYATAYYNQPGSLKYGDTGIYTMPLAATTWYKLTFAYRSHEDNSNNGITVSVLKGEEGLAATAFPKNGSTTEWKVVEKYFYTGAAGNYVLTLANSGNTWMTGVSITKVPATTTVIDENVAYTPVDKASTDVILNRTIKNEGAINTLVLPFDMDADDVTDTFGADAKVYVVDSYDAGTVTFKTQDVINANEPCLLTTSTAGTTYKLTGRTLKTGTPTATYGDLSFVGSYAASMTVPLGSFVLSGGKFYDVDSAVTLKGTRAYFTVSGVGIKALNIALEDEDDEATGIAEINSKKTADGAIYNMAGQRVGADYKGVVIKNGKKVFVK